MAAVSPYLSRLFYGTKPTVLADGLATVAVKNRVRDVNNKPLVGYRVTLYSDLSGSIVAQPYLTDARGYAVGLVSYIAAGGANITAEVGVEPEESSDSSATA